MKPYWTNGRATLWQGHVLDALAAMEAQSVHMAASSPPYYGLRSYNLPSLEWPPVSYAPMAGLPEIEVPGCDPGCEHVWGEEQVKVSSGGPCVLPEAGKAMTESRYFETSQGQYCQLCSGWTGSLGLEPTVEMYVGHLVLVARALWRVLRDDGTFWCNLGDSYAGSQQQGGNGSKSTLTKGGKPRAAYPGMLHTEKKQMSGLKPKDLIGVPWRVALALQADGWYLRSSIIWAKGISFCPTYSGSCMPESVRDRPTNSYEHVFLLSKNKRYFYDGEAVREAQREPFGGLDKGYAPSSLGHATPQGIHGPSLRGEGRCGNHATGRNLRSVWTQPDRDAFAAYCAEHGVDFNTLLAGFLDGQRDMKDTWVLNPGSFKGSHFATFSPKLVEPMIRAGTSAKGVCRSCGKPWERMTEKETKEPSYRKGNTPETEHAYWGESNTRTLGMVQETTTTGWVPMCSCSDWDPVPATILDPFAGTFTTGDVAIRLGRCAVGIELSKTYCDEHIIPRLSAGLQMELL